MALSLCGFRFSKQAFQLLVSNRRDIQREKSVEAIALGSDNVLNINAVLCWSFFALRRKSAAYHIIVGYTFSYYHKFIATTEINKNN